MIIWLASYPKSGNTWVRSFISTLMATEDGNSDLRNLKSIPQYPTRSFFNGILKNYEDMHEIKKKWSDILNGFNDYIPNHLINLLSLLDKDQAVYKSKILDHGCGAGYALFFLASKGYTNIWGIDVDETEEHSLRKNACNKIFKIKYIINIKSI